MIPFFYFFSRRSVSQTRKTTRCRREVNFFSFRLLVNGIVGAFTHTPLLPSGTLSPGRDGSAVSTFFVHCSTKSHASAWSPLLRSSLSKSLQTHRRTAPIVPWASFHILNVGIICVINGCFYRTLAVLERGFFVISLVQPHCFEILWVCSDDIWFLHWLQYGSCESPRFFGIFTCNDNWGCAGSRCYV